MRDDTFLLRHVKLMRFFQGDYVTSEAFIPHKKKDNGKLSVYDGEFVTPDKAVEHQRKFGGTTYAVVGILPDECKNVLGCDLPVSYDPQPDSDCHMEIDFNVLGSRSKQEKAGGILRNRTKDRGFLWREEESQI